MNRYFVAAILSVLAFSTIGPFVKLLLPDYPLPWITFARAFFGFLFVLLIVPKFDKKYFVVRAKDRFDYAIVGFTLAATMMFYNSAFSLSPLADVVLLNYTHVFWAPILAYFVLREKMEKGVWMFLLAGIVGLVLINPFDGQSVQGNLLALGAGLTYGVMTVFMRKLDKHHHLGDVVWFLGFASLFLLVPALTTPLEWTWHGFILLMLAGVVSTGLGYLLFNLALEGLHVHQVGILDLTLGTLIGVVLSLFVFHESLSTMTLLGGVLLVVAGGLFLQRQHLLALDLKLSLPMNGHGRKRVSSAARASNRRGA